MDKKNLIAALLGVAVGLLLGELADKVRGRMWPSMESRVAALESRAGSAESNVVALANNQAQIADAVWKDVVSIRADTGLMEKSIVNLLGEKKWFRAVAEERAKLEEKARSGAAVQGKP